jgi:hypothetical protein
VDLEIADRRVFLGWAVAGSSLIVLAIAFTYFVAAGLGWDAVAIGEYGLGLALVVTGGLVTTYSPRNLFGWSTMITGTFICLTLLAASFGYHQLRQEPDGDYYRVAIWLSCWLWVPAVSMPAINFAIFPDGHLASRRWKWVPWLAALAGTLAATSLAFYSWPFRGPLLLAGPGWLPELVPMPRLTLVGIALLVVALAGAVASMMRSMFAAVGVERNQYKWFALSGVFSVVALLVSLRVGASIPAAMAIGGLVAPPGVLVAMFRYRLYDIDRLINRTIVYGIVTGLLALIYIVGTIFVGAAVKTLTGSAPSETVVAISTLAVAALFRPIRARIQELIDRRFYRHKYDASLTIERFSSELREEVDLDELTVHLLGVVEETMQPERVSLWLRPAPDPG